MGVVETAGHRFPVPRPALQFQDVLHWPLVASFPGVSVCVHECIRVVIFTVFKKQSCLFCPAVTKLKSHLSVFVGNKLCK